MSECSSFKRYEKKFKKKMDDSSSSDESQVEEVVNLCLMANIEENPSYSSDSILNFTLDELHDAFNDLMNEFENVSMKNNVLKKKLKSLDKEVSLLKEEKDSWNNEKKLLKA